MTFSLERTGIVLLTCVIFAMSSCRVMSDGPSARTSDATSAAVRVSPAEVEGAEPAIASDAGGNLYVVYVSHAGPQGDVFLQKYDPAMKAVGERTKINPVPGTAKSWRGDPPTIAVGPGGAVHVSWTRAVETEKGKGTDLMLSTSSDGGSTFAEPVRVNDDSAPASHGMHSLAVDKAGRVYMAWLDERNVKAAGHVRNLGDTQYHDLREADFEVVRIHHTPKTAESPAAHSDAEAEPNSEVYFALSTDGGKTFSTNKKVATDVCPCCKTSMLATADGRLYVSWRQVLDGDFRHIAVASTVDNGATFSAAAIVSDDHWKLHACPVSGSALALAADGSLDVFWYTAGEAGAAGFYKASSSDGGKTFGPRRMVSSGEATAGTPVAFNGTGKCLFGADGDKLRLTDTAHTSPVPVETMENASLAAATAVDGKVFAAFVRRSDDSRSVWLSAIR